MSQKTIQRRVCDYCDYSSDMEQNLTPQQAKELSSWTLLVREHLVNDQLVPIMKHGCKQTCVENILKLGMLNLPTAQQAEQDASEIDITALKNAAKELN